METLVETSTPSRRLPLVFLPVSPLIIVSLRPTEIEQRQRFSADFRLSLKRMMY